MTARVFNYLNNTHSFVRQTSVNRSLISIKSYPLSARNENGDVQCFPSVECEFNPEANLVEYLFSPANILRNITKSKFNRKRSH